VLSEPLEGGADALDLGGQWVGPGQDLALALVAELGLTLKAQRWFAAPAEAAEAAAGAAAGDAEAAKAAAAAGADAKPAGAEAAPPRTDAAAARDQGGDAAAAPPAAAASAAVGALLARPAAAARDPAKGESFSSGGGAPLSPADAAEVSEVTAALDALAAGPHAAGPPWGALAREWDAADAASRLRATIRGPAALREMLLYVQTVMACEPSELSFLYFLRCAAGFRFGFWGLNGLVSPEP
jgi:hypothetical protein